MELLDLYAKILLAYYAYLQAPTMVGRTREGEVELDSRAAILGAVLTPQEYHSSEFALLDLSSRVLCEIEQVLGVPPVDIPQRISSVLARLPYFDDNRVTTFVRQLTSTDIRLQR